MLEVERDRAEDRLKIEQTQRDSVERLRQRNKELEEQLRALCESQVKKASRGDVKLEFGKDYGNMQDMPQSSQKHFSFTRCFVRGRGQSSNREKQRSQIPTLPPITMTTLSHTPSLTT